MAVMSRKVNLGFEVAPEKKEKHYSDAFLFFNFLLFKEAVDVGKIGRILSEYIL